MLRVGASERNKGLGALREAKMVSSSPTESLGRATHSLPDVAVGEGDFAELGRKIPGVVHGREARVTRVGEGPQWHLANLEELCERRKSQGQPVSRENRLYTLTNILLLFALVEEHHCLALATSPRRSTTAMGEDLGILRRVNLQDDVDVWEIESTSSDVCAEENAGSFRGQSNESGEGGGAASRRHLAVERVDREVGELGEDGEDLCRPDRLEKNGVDVRRLPTL